MVSVQLIIHRIKNYFWQKISYKIWRENYAYTQTH
jgi:hypothetical protein